MKSFSELEKNCKKDSHGLKQFKLAIVGDCATQHLAKAVKGYAYDEKIGLEIFDADYNQLDAQFIDENSELYQYEPDFILIFLCSEKLWDAFCNTPQNEKHLFAKHFMEKLENYYQCINRRVKTNILQCNFMVKDDGVFGNYANKTEDSFLYQCRKLNYLLMEQCSRQKNMFMVDLDYLQCRYGQQQVFDNKMYYLAKLPISIKMLPEAAKLIVDIISGFAGKMKKCIILDLDNTLWGGVIGDDGMENIQIGELGAGYAFLKLQMWLKELRRRGIILAVCSKNNEDTAKEPFLHHPEMVLRLEDISMFVANWEDKAGNIKYIQQTLNIGMDSIVFLDDNPFERNLVRSMIEDITVPELPEDPAQYLEFLQGLNLFETISYSETDLNRTKQYQEEIERKTLEKNYVRYEDYLAGLEMEAVAKPFEKFYFSRIAQLTQRSNQFNLRTIRYTEAEIEELSRDEKYMTLYFTLKDKFGDYGLISLVILEKREDHTLFVTEWLMSCRVLKRGMEEFVIDSVIRLAKENGYDKVIGEYIPTPKNAMVKDLYSKMGFVRINENTYSAQVENYKYHDVFIREKR